MSLPRTVLLVALALPACGPASDDPSGQADPSLQPGADKAGDGPASSTVERGPVRVDLSLSPARPRLSDEPVLTLTVRAEEGVEVELPPFGDAIGGFLVRSFSDSLPSRQQGYRSVSQTYRLEPVETGEHVIRPITIRFRDGRQQGDGEQHEVHTEQLVVEVTSFLSGEEPDLAALRPAAGALPIEVASVFPWRPVLVASSLLLAVLLISLLLRSRRRRAPVERVLTPTELAEQELLALLQDDPLSRGELQTFFVELTGVVRRYIERSSGVRAPEQTTEEFLREMRRSAAFDADSRERLSAFLTAADMVKFAAFRPERTDIEESLRRAQEFVGLPGNMSLSRETAA